jgi:hypothetical protein
MFCPQQRASSSSTACLTQRGLLLQRPGASEIRCFTSVRDEALPLQGRYDAESAGPAISATSCAPSAMAKHL